MFSNTFEIPKSPSFTVLLPVRNMFYVLISLCKTFLPWTYSNAKHIYTNQLNISVSLKYSYFYNFLLTWNDKSPTIIQVNLNNTTNLHSIPLLLSIILMK